MSVHSSCQPVVQIMKTLNSLYQGNTTRMVPRLRQSTRVEQHSTILYLTTPVTGNTLVGLHCLAPARIVHTHLLQHSTVSTVSAHSRCPLLVQIMKTLNSLCQGPTTRLVPRLRQSTRVEHNTIMYLTAPVTGVTPAGLHCLAPVIAAAQSNLYHSSPLKATKYCYLATLPISK